MILDQTLLPNEKRYEKITSAEQMWDAIKKLKVRGAPAIGIAAAFGVYVEIVRQSPDSRESFLACVGNACKFLFIFETNCRKFVLGSTKGKRFYRVKYGR